ncbi:hypothetical protein DMUE_0416 [Dictyocoela muelleri]|nr:hypothetical protein DMUE_0416 [Dictyocoela muelleri]
MIESKSQNAYTLIFTKISKMINNSPKLLIIDFEIAVFYAASYVLKSIEIRGCNFHFNQIIVKFMNINGLINEYKRNNDFKKYVKYLSIQAFIPENKVEFEYEKIKRLKGSTVEYDLIDNFFRKNFSQNPLIIKKKEFWSCYKRT